MAVALLLITCDRNQEGVVVEKGTVDAKRRASVTAFWSAYRAGMDLARNGRRSAAAESLRAALAIDPLHEGALYNLGNISFERGLYTEAETAWLKLVRSHPHSARGFAQLGALHACGQDSTPFDLAAAEGYFLKMYEVNKEASEATVRLGEVFLLQGRTEEALERFERALSFDSGNREARILKGLVLWVRGDLAAARSVYEMAKPTKKMEDRPFASEEGDTRAGSRPMLVDGARHRSFFRQVINRALGGEKASVVYADAVARMSRL